MRSLDERLNQQEKAPHQYARLLGSRPINRAVKSEVYVTAQTLLAAFGPPEFTARRKSVRVFWNFVRDDNRKNFALVADVKAGRSAAEIPVQVVARAGEAAFLTWALGKMGAAENGDVAPLFLSDDPGSFLIGRVT